MYVKRKEGGRGFISAKQCIREEEKSFGFYVANLESKPYWRGIGSTINMSD